MAGEASMPVRMRALGLDVGSKTIGVAISDELGMAAHPRETLARKGTTADVAWVEAYVRAEGVERVVVGLPLELSGREGPRAKRVNVFIDALRARLGDAVPVETWDERFSTVGANRALMEADLSRARRKQVIDQQAAVFILQGWLDARSRPR
jgi:putative holliday junction resolvase